MRSLFALASLALSFAALTAQAAPGSSEAPHLTRVFHSGYTSVEASRPSRCEIFGDRVEIERQFGDGADKGVVVREGKQFRLSGNILKVLASAATEELVSTPNNLCDGPSSTLQAGETVLFSTGGCGSPRLERRGPYSRILRDLADLYCPTVPQ